MDARPRRTVAIVDYGLGNLFSVKHACEHVGLRVTITSCREEILASDVVILPGVGAFGDAMECLNRRHLVGPLHQVAQSDRLLIGICLGMQLLMSESYEFGRHKGLGIIEGPVVRFEDPVEVTGQGGDRTISRLKVPQVGWNRVFRTESGSVSRGTAAPAEAEGSRASPLDGIRDGEYMYFVHSFYAIPEDPKMVVTTSRYGHIQFCSSLACGNVIGFQFHPERSGPAGLQVYRNLLRALSEYSIIR